ncbi:MAG: hypothetical protein ACR5LC_05785 [Symbiopectobacterium sp.]|uniref:hypothetical protein n=1 Tax=Symbiopectobacterium sp. TaxID=2952789 RepID=UPI003F2ED1E3
MCFCSEPSLPVLPRWKKTGLQQGKTRCKTIRRAYLDWLRYAGSLAVHLSLRAPYDIALYANDVDAAVASYAYFGCNNGVCRGKSMIALAKVLTGNASPQGKMLVVVGKDYDAETNTDTVAFPRGFGLSW